MNLNRIDYYSENINNILIGVSWLWWAIGYISNLDSNITFSKVFFSSEKDANEEYIREKVILFDEKIELLEKLKEKLESDKDIEEEVKDIFLKSIEANLLNFEIFKNSIYLEAKKLGFPLSDEKSFEYNEAVLELQTKIYWERASDIPEEKQEILETFNNFYEKNWYKLSQEERKEFEQFLTDFWIEAKEILAEETSNIIESTKKVTKNILDKKIKASDFKKIFEMVLDIYSMSEWEEKWTVEIKDVAWASVSIKEREFIIPDKDKSIEEVLRLIDHELEGHWIRWKNNLKVLREITWFRYLFLEEWLIKVFRHLLFNDDNKLEDIDTSPNISHLTLFVWENYNGDDTEKILRLYYKMELKKWENESKINREARGRAFRVKWFLDWDQKWANRKDVSYTRWLKQAVELLKTNLGNSNAKKIKDFMINFYFAKLWTEDFSKVDKLKKVLWINDEDVQIPELIWYILLRKLRWEKITLENLQEKDFRFEAHDAWTTDFKRKIVKILNHIENIEEVNNENF